MVASCIMKRGFVGLRMIHIRKMVRSIRRMKAPTAAIMRRRKLRRSSSSWWPHSLMDMVVAIIA